MFSTLNFDRWLLLTRACTCMCFLCYKNGVINITPLKYGSLYRYTLKVNIYISRPFIYVNWTPPPFFRNFSSDITLTRYISYVQLLLLLKGNIWKKKSWCIQLTHIEGGYIRIFTDNVYKLPYLKGQYVHSSIKCHELNNLN